jgi:hypothetical protein
VSPLDLVEGTVVAALFARLAARRIVGKQANVALVKRRPKVLVGVQHTVATNARRSVSTADATAVHHEARVGHAVAAKARLVKERSVLDGVKAHAARVDSVVSVGNPLAVCTRQRVAATHTTSIDNGLAKGLRHAIKARLPVSSANVADVKLCARVGNPVAASASLVKLCVVRIKADATLVKRLVAKGNTFTIDTERVTDRVGRRQAKVARIKRKARVGNAIATAATLTKRNINKRILAVTARVNDFGPVHDAITVLAGLVKASTSRVIRRVLAIATQVDDRFAVRNTSAIGTRCTKGRVIDRQADTARINLNEQSEFRLIGKSIEKGKHAHTHRKVSKKRKRKHTLTTLIDYVR